MRANTQKARVRIVSQTDAIIRNERTHMNLNEAIRLYDVAGFWFHMTHDEPYDTGARIAYFEQTGDRT